MLVTTGSTKKEKSHGSIWSYADTVYWVPLILASSALFAVFAGLLGNGQLPLIICAYAALLAFWGGRPEALALVWLALSPVASYLLRYPSEQSLLTFDRVLIAALTLAVAGRVLREREETLRAGIFELFWLLFAG